MRIALAQLNPVVGDFEGNAKRILEAVRRAEEQAVELVLTPELSLWGYPPRDQLLRAQPSPTAEHGAAVAGEPTEQQRHSLGGSCAARIRCPQSNGCTTVWCW